MSWNFTLLLLVWGSGLYDAEGRICAVENTPVAGVTVMAGYIYNAEGQRVAKGSSWGCDSASNRLTTQSDYVLALSGEQLTELSRQENGQMASEHSNVYANGQLMATYDNDGLHFHRNDARWARAAPRPTTASGPDTTTPAWGAS